MTDRRPRRDKARASGKRQEARRTPDKPSSPARRTGRKPSETKDTQPSRTPVRTATPDTRTWTTGKRVQASDAPASEAAGGRERIAKRIARAGVCSRRDAEVLIRDGRVKVGGARIDSPATIVGPGDIILVDGQPLPDAEPARLWRFNKPRGVVTTARDEKGRRTVFDCLPPGTPRLLTVGRLDMNSEGFLLLTNDGGLKRHLELPATGWTRRYRVRAYGRVDPAALQRLEKGVTIDGVRYGPIDAKLDLEQGSNAWLTIGLKEGKNREVRKVMEHVGLTVNRLIRVAYGPFQLGKLPEGQMDEIPRRVLRDQIPSYFGNRPARRETHRSNAESADVVADAISTEGEHDA